ncbi:MAG TPA: 16S rRNA (guanine(966)-N(2))-methyltransferase RsmD [Selenomonadales bacterium]|nr:16S rRNA (guanine(966)-N(2))-methyltransferase RsmD [Selenomonadales bacterium]
MRIITGSAKGFKLKAPKGLDVRPTSDRVKESIFSILADRVGDAAVADLFAGTGNLGLEALSRGAEQVVFVDNSHTSMSFIKENAARTKLFESAQFMKSDVLAAIEKLAAGGRVFDIIFCDPPYNRGFVEKALRSIDRFRLLAPGGMIVVEHSKHEPVPADLSHLAASRTERYGETLVSFVQ